MIEKLLSEENINIDRKPELWVFEDFQELLLSPAGELLSQVYTKGDISLCTIFAVVT